MNRVLQRNLIGNKYGKLTVIENGKKDKKSLHFLSKVRCECGYEFWIKDTYLVNNKTIQCKNCALKQLGTHHMTNTKLFNVWQSIKERCYTKTCDSYKYYGARNIMMCQEWKEDFFNFYNWAINNGYKPRSINR